MSSAKWRDITWLLNLYVYVHNMNLYIYIKKLFVWGLNKFLHLGSHVVRIVFSCVSFPICCSQSLICSWFFCVYLISHVNYGLPINRYIAYVVIWYLSATHGSEWSSQDKHCPVISFQVIKFAWSVLSLRPNDAIVYVCRFLVSNSALFFSFLILTLSIGACLG